MWESSCETYLCDNKDLIQNYISQAWVFLLVLSPYQSNQVFNTNINIKF